MIKELENGWAKMMIPSYMEKHELNSKRILVVVGLIHICRAVIIQKISQQHREHFW